MAKSERGGVQPFLDGLAAFTRTANFEYLRDQRAAEVSRALFGALTEPQAGPRTPPPIIAQAILEHRFQAAKWFALSEDRAKWQAMLRADAPLKNWIAAETEAPVAVSLANVDGPSHRIGEAPAYLIGTETTLSPPDALVELAGRSFDFAAGAGFRPLLGAVGALVLVRHRDLLGQSNSWTTTSLPGTIYTDFTDHPDALAVEVVHEAAHLWLNDAFRAAGFPEQSKMRFQSPWKDAPRQVFGFVHAMFAFSCVVIFVRQMLARANTTPGAVFLHSMHDREANRLVEVARDVPKALSLVPNEVAEIVGLAHRTATSVGRAQ